MTAALILLTIAAMALWGWQEQQKTRQREQCLANVRRLSRQIEEYAARHGRLPGHLAELGGTRPECPAAGKDTYSGGYTVSGMFCNLKCSGPFHETPPQAILKFRADPQGSRGKDNTKQAPP